MLPCFANSSVKNSIPINLVTVNQFPQWLKSQEEFTKQWINANQFVGETGNLCFIPNDKGLLARVIYCVPDLENFWSIGNLPMILPFGTYYFENENIDSYYFNLALGWGLGAYQFKLYKQPLRNPAELYVPEKIQPEKINNIVESLFLVRDLINIPTDDLGPSELADVVIKLASLFNANVKQIIGEELIKENYPAIYTVGKASDDPPRLIDLRWGDAKHPKITLVGKGVCFDSGGLDIKSAAAMELMKKDMAGAAHVLGLARMLMQSNAPIQLRVLIPAVENVIAGNAYHPGDIIKSRKGTTIEIGNTDAEGRVILADVLTEAINDKPDLLIDITTLTGAARIAVGTDIAAMFSNKDDIAEGLLNEANKVIDPIWRLPLYTPYRELLNTPFADINNTGIDGYGGAITAALFLKEFVPDNIPWVHFDLMAWNLRPRPGKPQGGEAMALRALYQFIIKRFC